MSDEISSEEASTEREGPKHPVWHFISVMLSTALLVLVVAVAFAAIIVPRAAGGTALTVLSSSMEPKYPIGTMVVIRPAAAVDINVGDVITYQITSGDPTVATHRVIEKGLRHDGEIQFITQGDNNSVPDPEPVREVQVRGAVWYSVPYLGHVAHGLNNGGRAWLVPVAAMAFLGYGGWLMLSGVRDRRKRSGHRTR